MARNVRAKPREISKKTGRSTSPTTKPLQTSAEAESSSFEGVIKGVTPQKGLEGWAWDKTKPYTAINVGLYANDTLITAVAADSFEMGLAERNIGNGKHAFTLRIKSWANISLPVVLDVRVIDTEHSIGKISIETEADIAKISERFLIGHVDGIIGGEIRGWAFDQLNPVLPVEIDVVVDGAVIRTIVCSEYRQDLAAAGYADGFCGFSFSLPLLLLDGNTHSIAINFSQSLRSLQNGTMLFGLTRESELTKAISNLSQAVVACRNDLATVEKRLMARHESLLAIQRENIERELQVLRQLLVKQRT